MTLFGEILSHVYPAVFLVMTVVAFSWHPKKGKWLMCTHVTLLFFGSLIKYCMALLNVGAPFAFGLGSLVYIFAYVFLLAYLIKLRDKPSDAPESSEPEK